MTTPLFSTYTQGENRVTSTVMAVLGHISTTLTEDILEMLLDESSLSLVSIDNQISGASSVPDAAIRASTSIWFETKTVRKGVDPDQLQRHLMELQSQEAGVQRLVALTPDAEQPPEIDSIDDERLVWANFSQLVDAIESILDRDTGTTEETVAVPTEREAFLLRELVRFIYDEDLVSGKEDRVLVVAARRAWPDYKDYGMYFCQAGRSFKPVSHLAFYTDGEIKPIIPRVTKAIDAIELTKDAVNTDDRLTSTQREELLNVVDQMKQENAERYEAEEQVLFLGEPIELSRPITNDKTASDSDRTVAFVQGHRYASLSRLKDEPEWTTQLE